MKTNNKGQAAILIIFVVGMVGLMIGMSLTKTGFAESIMGRSVVNSTYAFYVANSGVEDAFYKIRTMNYGDPGSDSYSLKVGEGEAKITVSGGRDEKVIESEGRYRNSVRRIRVTARNTTISPGFTRAIQAGTGGIEFGQGVTVAGRYKNGDPYPVTIHSNSYVRGARNGSTNSCSSSSSTTRIAGHVYAVGSIEKIAGSDSGPCVEGNAFAGSLKECRVFGTAYSNTTIESTCPYSNLCDADTDPENCNAPVIEPLPDIGVPAIKEFMEENAKRFDGNCEIGGSNDCSTERPDGFREIGNLIVNGNLRVNLSSNREIYISGPVWVTGELIIEQNHTIRISPEITDLSQIILTSKNIVVRSNTRFVSVNNSFLLIASEYENTKPNVCSDTSPAISIASNVNSILFYAINGCAMVDYPTAGSEFYGAIVGEGIWVRNNSNLTYDPALQDAEFFLRRRGGWQITSFTER